MADFARVRFVEGKRPWWRKALRIGEIVLTAVCSALIGATVVLMLLEAWVNSEAELPPLDIKPEPVRNDWQK